jgi:hypothetical protein
MINELENVDLTFIFRELLARKIRIDLGEIKEEGKEEKEVKEEVKEIEIPVVATIATAIVVAEVVVKTTTEVKKSNESINCGCGGKYKKGHISHHIKTKMHLLYVDRRS